MVTRSMLMACLLFACGGGHLGAVAASRAADVTWRVYNTAHFDLSTDQEPQDAARTAELLERTHAMLSALTAFTFSANVPPLTERIRVVAFRDRDDFVSLHKQRGIAAMALPPQIPVTYSPTILLAAESLRDERIQIVVHELFHIFAHHYLPQIPRWLNEGLAMYFSTVGTTEGKVALGAIQNNTHFKMLARRQADVAPLEVLLTGFPDQRNINKFYNGALAMTYLLNTRDAVPSGPYAGKSWRELFLAYVNAMAAGRKPKLTDFVDENTLDDAYRTRIFKFDRQVWLVDFTMPTITAVRPRELRAQEIHLLWASLRLAFADVDEAQTHATAALALETTVDAQVTEALLLKRQKKDGDAKRLLAKAIEAAPKDERLRYAQLHVLDDAEVDDALIRAFVQVAQHAESFNSIADYYLRKKKLALGMEFAARAVKAKRTCHQCWVTTAELLAASGDPQKGIPLVEQAIGLLPHGASTKDYEEYLQTLKTQAASQPVAH